VTSAPRIRQHVTSLSLEHFAKSWAPHYSVDSQSHVDCSALASWAVGGHCLLVTGACWRTSAWSAVPVSVVPRHAALSAAIWYSPRLYLAHSSGIPGTPLCAFWNAFHDDCFRLRPGSDIAVKRPARSAERAGRWSADQAVPQV
jgi:hypothetical protein